MLCKKWCTNDLLFRWFLLWIKAIDLDDVFKKDRIEVFYWNCATSCLVDLAISKAHCMTCWVTKLWWRGSFWERIIRIRHSVSKWLAASVKVAWKIIRRRKFYVLTVPHLNLTRYKNRPLLTLMQTWNSVRYYTSREAVRS